MADSEKRISFKGVDQGAGDMMDKLRSKSQELGQSIIENTRKTSSSSKDFIQNLREQISLEEKRIRLREQSQKYEAKETYKRESESEDFSVRSQAKEKYQETTQSIEGESEQAKLQTDLLRELVEETKEKARQETQQDKEAVEEKASNIDNKYFGKNAQEPESGDEIEVLKRSFQNQQLDEEKNEAAVSDARNKMDSAANAAISPLSAVSQVGFGIGAIGAYMASQGNQYQQSAEKVEALTGLNYMGKSYSSAARDYEGSQMEESKARMYQTTDIGITSAELFKHTESLARKRGFGGENAISETRDLLKYERGTGLQEGEMQALAKGASMRESGKGTSDLAINLVNKLKEETDIFNNGYARLPQVMETLTSLTEQQLQHLKNIDTESQIGFISALQKIGGPNSPFKSPEMQGELATTINESMKNPDNQFEKAFSYQAISNLNEGPTSYFETQKAMEKGAFYSPENTDKTRIGEELRMLGRRGFSTDKFSTRIMKRMNLSANQSELLAEEFENNPDLFRGLGSMDEKSTKQLKQKLKKRAPERTAMVDKLMAKISETAGGGGASIMEKLEEKMDVISENGISSAVEEALYNWSNGWLGSKLPSGNKNSNKIPPKKIKQQRRMLKDLKQNNNATYKALYGDGENVSVSEALQKSFPNKNINYNIDLDDN